MEQTEAKVRRRKSVLIPAVLAVLLWPPVGAFGAMAAMMSPMLYDAPGSEDNPFIAIMVFGAVSLPLLCLLAAVASLWFAVKEWKAPVKRLKVWIWAGLPLASVVLFLLGAVLIDVFCDGQLQCDGF